MSDSPILTAQALAKLINIINDGSTTADGSITSAKLADGAATTAKVANAAITGPKLADGSVTNTKIVDGTVTSVKMADGTVTTTKIADGAVSPAKLDPAVALSMGDMRKNVYDTANSGVVDQAKKLSTPRTISLTGGVTGSTTFDGSGNASIAATVVGGGAGGDMLKSTYDTTNNGVVDAAEKLSTPRSIALTGSVTGSATFDGTAGITITTTGGAGGAANLYATNKPFSYMVNDAPFPVVSDGIPFGVAQILDNTLAGNMFASPAGPMEYVNGLDTGSLLTFNRAAHTGLGIIGYHKRGFGVWSMQNQGLTNVKKFGYPGVSIIAGSSNANTNTDNLMRLTQRWYAVPGVPNALYCEIELTKDPDATQTGNANIYWQDPGAGLPTDPGSSPNIVWSAYARGNYLNPNDSTIAAYDAALDGVSFRGNNASQDAGWYFIRPVNHKTTGHYYSVSSDANLFYGTGVLPTGVDSLDLSTLTTPYDYQVYLSGKLEGGYRQHNVFRFVVGRGFTVNDAKQATMNAPDISSDAVIEQWYRKLDAIPTPAGLSGDEEMAWRYYMHTLTFNARSTTNTHHPEALAYSGVKKRILFASLGRWQGTWSGDTAQGINALAAIDPSLVKDNLDYYLNQAMDKVTGFVRGDTQAWGTGVGTSRTGGWVQNAAFHLGRAALRYQKATNDRGFIDPLYPNLKLLFQYWLNTPGYQHPKWADPTTPVYLLTGRLDVEVGEDAPETPGSVTPKGDVVTTSLAYDYCVQMSTLATIIGQPQSEIDFWNLWSGRFKTAVQTYCWNPTINWYVPVGVSGAATDLTPFNTRTSRGYYALWAGIPTPTQAQSMRDIIMNTANFKGTYGMRSLDKTAPGYNPNHWTWGGSRPQHDGALASGLYRYGFQADGDYVIGSWTKIQNKFGSTPEAANPDTQALGYAKFMTMGAGNLIEGLLFKSAPSLLYGAGTSIGG